MKTYTLYFWFDGYEDWHSTVGNGVIRLCHDKFKRFLPSESTISPVRVTVCNEQPIDVDVYYHGRLERCENWYIRIFGESHALYGRAVEIILADLSNRKATSDVWFKIEGI